MARLAARAVQSVFVVFAAASFAFALLHLAPGDPFSTMAIGGNVPPEQRAQWRAEKGYDRPLGVQYLRWIGNVARGEFGLSTSERRPVIDVIADRLPNTLVLMSLGLVASIVLGSWLGAWQGARAGRAGDRAVSFVSLILYSVPEFWFASMLAFVFAYKLHFLPASGMIEVSLHDSMTPGQQLVDRLRHLVLPWTTLTVMGTAIFARYQRITMRDTMREPFVRTARALGLSEATVRRRAWRASFLPVLTLAGLFFPALLTGAVFVEQIFGWPGMGHTLIDAIFSRDYELVSACVVVGSAMTALGTLLADIARELLDPRLRRA